MRIKKYALCFLCKKEKEGEKSEKLKKRRGSGLQQGEILVEWAKGAETAEGMEGRAKTHGCGMFIQLCDSVSL